MGQATDGGDTSPVETTRVLVVEDDTGLRNALVRGLSEHGLQVAAVPDGGSALESLTDPARSFDVVVMDIGLPDSDGRDVCQAMRTRGITAGVLFLTARDQLDDLMSGFAAGGDDYLAKPFHFAELLARLTALARRTEPLAPAPSRSHLDPRQHAVVDGDVAVALTPTEYRIFAVLLGSPGRVIRRRELTAAAWPAGAIVQDNTLDQYVARLRRKMEALPDPPSIVTVHGVGYRLE